MVKTMMERVGEQVEVEGRAGRLSTEAALELEGLKKS